MSRKQRFIVAAAVCLALSLASGLSRSADLEECPKDPGVSGPLRCALWEICGFMRLQAGSRERTTGRVVLPSGRSAVCIASYRTLSSSWPDSITMSFYEPGGDRARPIETIRDQGLDGLRPETPGDEYLRYNEQGLARDMLGKLDPVLEEPLNKDYRVRTAEILAALARRENVHSPLNWETIRPGLETAQVTAFRYVRLGGNRVRLLRVDPKLYDFVPFSRDEQAEYRALHIEAWARRLPEAAAVFNAGQYYPDYKHMGLLIKKDRNLGTDLHPGYKGLLVSGGPPARIIDLAAEEKGADYNRYAYVVQSFMLLDERGRVRVRRTDRLASRTVCAQDARGRIICVWVPGAASLYDLGLWLKQSDLDVVKALCLDGGFESQALIRTGGEEIVNYGAWVVNEKRQYFQRLLKLPLPAIIAVLPRSGD